MYLRVYILLVLTTVFAVSNFLERHCLLRYHLCGALWALTLFKFFLSLLEQVGLINLLFFILLLVVLKYLKFSYRTDCCDGSDEYDGFAKCTNNCWEAGKASREKLVKKANVYRDGVKIRRSEIESGKKLRQQNDIKLTTLRKEEKLLSEQVKKLKGWWQDVEGKYYRSHFSIWPCSLDVGDRSATVYHLQVHLSSFIALVLIASCIFPCMLESFLLQSLVFLLSCSKALFCSVDIVARHCFSTCVPDCSGCCIWTMLTRCAEVLLNGGRLHVSLEL